MSIPTVALSDDCLTLTVVLDEYTATYGRSEEEGPFTAKDIAYVIERTPQILARQREGGFSSGRKFVKRHRLPRGWQVWVHVNTGPPTWWFPRVSLRKGIMVGWLRGLVAVHIDRQKPRPTTATPPAPTEE